MTPAILQSLLARAQTEALGLVVETNNPMYLYQLLVNTNKPPGGMADSGADLIIARPPGPLVYIVRREAYESHHRQERSL
jgi:hypothetical protein